MAEGRINSTNRVLELKWQNWVFASAVFEITVILPTVKILQLRKWKPVIDKSDDSDEIGNWLWFCIEKDIPYIWC